MGIRNNNQQNQINELAVQIIETLRQPLLILDGELTVIGANKAFYKNFQANHDETINRFIYDLGNGQWDIPALRHLLEEIIPEQNTIEDFDVVQSFPDIGERIMHLNARRLQSSDSYPEMILLAIEDITDRRTTEAKLQQYNDALQRSNEELQQFAYVASHDLQEPLRAISGYVQLLQQKYEALLDDKARYYIHQSVDSVARLQLLINDLLQYSRVGSQGKPFVSTNCSALLADALKSMDTLISETNAEITSDPLPVVQGDSPQLNRLLVNLLHNGLKYRGENVPHIHVSARQIQGFWLFSVQDNGIGIEADYFERIFAIFQRLHTRREYPGTGIGLAIAKRIVERHEGRIWVESDGQTGSTFYFTIPDQKTISFESALTNETY